MARGLLPKKIENKSTLRKEKWQSSSIVFPGYIGVPSRYYYKLLCGTPYPIVNDKSYAILRFFPESSTIFRYDEPLTWYHLSAFSEEVKVPNLWIRTRSLPMIMTYEAMTYDHDLPLKFDIFWWSRFYSSQRSGRREQWDHTWMAQENHSYKYLLLPCRFWMQLHL